MNAAMSVYKPDWAEARQRMIAWWAGAKTDRAPAYVSAPKSNRPARKRKTAVPDRWIDPDTIFYNLDLSLESTWWGGEAFPHHEVHFGPMFSVACYGGEPVFTANTVWYNKLFAGWQDADRARFDSESRWSRLIRDVTRRSVERSGGRYLVTVSGACGVFDIMAQLFGDAEVLMAMLTAPEQVKALRDKMIAWGKQTYDEIYAITAPFQEGSMDGMRIWGPGRVWYVQCDLCAMISPELFRDLVLEEIRAFVRHVDYGIYHLDGKEEIRHLDALLAIAELKLIQYVPNVPPGQETFYRDPMNWIALYKRIQAGGKKCWIICPPERVEPLLRAIDRQGVFLYINCRDEAEAQRVLADLDRIGT